MSASDWLPQPIETVFGGATVLARRLGKLEIFSVAESYIIEDELRLIQQHAALIPSEERAAFIDRQHDKLPRGASLTEKAADLFTSGNTPNVMLYKLASASLGKEWPVERVAEVGEANPEHLASIVSIALGMDKKKLP